ncbi:hypothetical protein [Kordiimonas lacus]|uniref:Uncharacterized protein n=1 Tax=Kordiimonas lacus TaxID=637679 RepID=A0A1G6XW32_9PROT|nr:hypothetical protein [Kordiimonas lacus]SDD82191.1 hypothetical protein SAMN04488071_1386 [Kordiimonas lacus]
MDNNTLAIYIHELRNQCLHAQASFDLFNQAVVNKAANGVLYGGQMVLMPSSQISSLLWPTRARARGRGEALRKVLQLPEKHPLNDRRLAELWERADEKVEEWITNTKGRQVVFDFVGDPAQLGEGNTPEECIYRAYNPNTHTFYYRGVGYNLQAVAKALSDVGGRVNAVYRQLFPEHAKAEDEARRQAMEAQQAAAAAQQTGSPAPESAAANDVAPEPIDLSGGEAQAEEKPAKKAAPKKKPAAKKAAPKKKAAAKKAD